MLSLEKIDGKRLCIMPDAIIAIEEDGKGSAIWYQFSDQLLAAQLAQSFADVVQLTTGPWSEMTHTFTRAEPVAAVRLPLHAIVGINEIARAPEPDADPVPVTQLAVRIGQRQVIYEVKETAVDVLAAIEARKPQPALAGPEPISPPAKPAARAPRKPARTRK